MATTPDDASSERLPLTRDRVLDAAVVVADRAGIAALTMRSLAAELGVGPMAIYHHLANKEAVLDGIVDRVFGEIDLPEPGAPWRAEVRRRAVSCRQALARHPWAIPLMESRAAPGPATLRQHEAVVGTLRQGGFSVAQAAQAYAVLDSYLYGFALQEAAVPFNGPDEVPEVVGALLVQMSAAEHPYLMEMTTEHVLQPGYDFGDEFERGLDLVLDGIERLLGSRS
jgi:AcrR family transcriptional regulator